MVQLTWENWNAVCDFANVGTLENNQPTGCYIGGDLKPLPDNHTSNKLGLLIPTKDGVIVAVEGDFIARGYDEKLFIIRETNMANSVTEDQKAQLEVVRLKLKYHTERLMQKYPSDADLGSIGAYCLIQMDNIINYPLPEIDSFVHEGGSVSLSHYAKLCTLLGQKNKEIDNLKNQISRLQSPTN